MAEIGQTGSTQSQQVDYSPGLSESAETESLGNVGSGNLSGQNIKQTVTQAGSDILLGQRSRAPELDQPQGVKPTQLEMASTEVADISKLTGKVVTNTSLLMQNIQSGALTHDQQERIQRYSITLEETASYLQVINGKQVASIESKKSFISAMGHNDGQVEAFFNRHDDEVLASRHGGREGLQGKKDSLKSMGFSDSQIDALLALADPDDASNSLASMHGAGGATSNFRNALNTLGFSDGRVSALVTMVDSEGGNLLSFILKAGTEAKDKIMSIGLSQAEASKLILVAMGFSSAQADGIIGLLNRQSTGSDGQKQLLMQMGFVGGEADVVLVLANRQMLNAQEALIRMTSDMLADELEEAASAIRSISTGSPIADKVLQQLADIFIVLELLFEMSILGRRTARETRAIEYDAAKQQILNQAGEMRKAAVMTLVAGVVGGTMKVAAGATAMAGGMGGSKQSVTQSQMKMQRAMQTSQMVGSVGELGGAGFQFQSSEHNSRQKELEAVQKTHDNSAQSESEWMQLQQDMVKTVQAKMDEIIRTWFETLKTTTRG
ncbi:MAG: hypothetical protein ACR2PT_12540 [Endozoicomonas sp.]